MGISRLRSVNIPWTSAPPIGTEIDWSNPLTKGLRSFYILDKDRWHTNQVTGIRSGVATGGGPTFPNGKLRTPGTNDESGVQLSHNLSLSLTYPITLLVGYQNISGLTGWSLLSQAAIANYYSGFWASTTGTIISSQNGSFDGIVSGLGNLGSIGYCYRGNNDATASSGKILVLDTTAVAPVVESPNIYLGYFKQFTADLSNSSISEFTHFAAIQGAVSDEDLSSLALSPWQLFTPSRVSVPMVLPTYRPGSDVSTSGWVGTPDNTALFTNIDDISVDDADYISSTDSSTPAIFGLTSALVAGTYDITIRAKFVGAGRIRVLLLNSSNTVLATSSWQTLTASYATYLLNVVLAATATRFRIEIAPN